MGNERHRSNGRFTKGASGNPAGRPPGSKNKTSLAVEAMLDGDGELIARKAIELAKKGDVQALRLCLERILPPRRERIIELELRPVQNSHDLPLTYNDILQAVGEGRITPGEGQQLSNIITNRYQAAGTLELFERLEQVEKLLANTAESLRRRDKTSMPVRTEVDFPERTTPKLPRPQVQSEASLVSPDSSKRVETAPTFPQPKVGSRVCDEEHAVIPEQLATSGPPGPSLRGEPTPPEAAVAPSARKYGKEDKTDLPGSIADWRSQK